MTKKTRFINELFNLSADEKEKTISFFSKYPCYENLIDWNRRFWQYSDFQKILKIADNSRRHINRKAKCNPELLFKGYN